MRSLGIGVFTWARCERVSDRYGSVYLIPEGNNSLTGAAARSLVSVPAGLAGEGSLWVIVTETRASTHIGDLFRGFLSLDPKGRRKDQDRCRTVLYGAGPGGRLGRRTESCERSRQRLARSRGALPRA